MQSGFYHLLPMENKGMLRARIQLSETSFLLSRSENANLKGSSRQLHVILLLPTGGRLLSKQTKAVSRTLPFRSLVSRLLWFRSSIFRLSVSLIYPFWAVSRFHGYDWIFSSPYLHKSRFLVYLLSIDRTKTESLVIGRR